MSIVRRSTVAAVVATLVAPGGWFIAQGAGATSPPPVTFTVNSTGDLGEAGPAGVCQTSNKGECTLRAALSVADQAAAPVNIYFNIPGSGVQTIAPQSVLPGVNNANGYPITIDGFTQPGASPNTDPLVDNAVRLIELVGPGTGTNSFKGLELLSHKNLVRGLDIHGFTVQFLMTGTNSYKNTIEGNLIGLKPDGTLDPFWTGSRIKGDDCIAIISSNTNIIGAPGNANRNTISGCYNSGVALSNGHTGNNVVQNNIIGLDPTGTQRRGNQSMGVDHDWGVTGTMVGGTAFQQGNVVSGNIIDGVQISHGTTNDHNNVIGNLIGTDPTGTVANAQTMNGRFGVYVEGRPNCNTKPCQPDEGFETVSNNVIVNSGSGGVIVDKGNHDDTIANNDIGVLSNGTEVGNGPTGFGVMIAAGATRITVGPGNVIAGNQHGIQGTPYSISPVNNTISSPTEYNKITQNSIYDNASTFGIDWLPYNQVNQGNGGDPNFNEAINVPVLTASPGMVSVQTCANCVVELFASNQAIGTYGSGISYIASATADSTGLATFTTPSAGWPAVLTATATMTDGSSSEFAAAIAAPTS